ncbi:hypothetical protein E1281_25865 [Actinomadura sp. KC345]|uniref:hypothetical protein n=1 Tax=Actinomadura sp. KC345 TaxID=2530371 RepID=UPI00105181A3|nr:hypothetical protein [Actinomadura sp. KC345]TDC47703.1 hypothetical protein E1281_25865 [Actinomadura sp. KC345]
MDSYSYTTVSVKPDGSAHTSVSMLPDKWLSVVCPRGKDRAQISLSHSRADVTLSPTNATAPTAGDVWVARKLATSFALYAAEVERLHVANGGSEPAQDPAA